MKVILKAGAMGIGLLSLLSGCSMFNDKEKQLEEKNHKLQCQVCDLLRAKVSPSPDEVQDIAACPSTTACADVVDAAPATSAAPAANSAAPALK